MERKKRTFCKDFFTKNFKIMLDCIYNHDYTIYKSAYKGVIK